MRPDDPTTTGLFSFFPLPATPNRNKVIDLLCRGERRKYTCLETDGDVTSCHRSVVVSYQSGRRTEPVDSAQLGSSLNVINPHIKNTPRDPCFWLLETGDFVCLEFFLSHGFMTCYHNSTVDGFKADPSLITLI